jgi:uncharacterized protein with gpF-like domain
MKLSEANKQLRYFRIQQMYKELDTYHLKYEFIEQTLCQFFTVGPATITMAIKEAEIKNVHYEYIDLDKEYVAQIVKRVQSKQYRAAKKGRSSNQNQIKLTL